MSRIPTVAITFCFRSNLKIAGLFLALLVGASTSAWAVTLTDITAGDLGDPSESRSFAWGDADGDGDLDLYIANTGPNKLLENQAGTFVDITPVAVADTSQSYAATWVDVDRDGDLDLYVSNLAGANKLFLNQGGMSFLESTPAALADTLDTTTSVWADYDGDGDLDVYVVNVNGPNRLIRTDSAELPDGSLQIIDNVEVTPAGMDLGAGARTAAWGDFDNDGDLDLHVGLDGTADKIFENQGGSFVEHLLPATSRSFGIAWGDYDEDGDLDLFTANYNSDQTLFRNEGGFNFTDVAPTLGLTLNGSGVNLIGASWVDWDNDGDLDLHLVSIDTSDRLCENLGGGIFAAPVVSPIDPSGRDWSAGWVDLNDDGIREVYLSTVIVAGSAPNVLAQAASTGNHWFTVKAHSRPGTRVWLTAGGVTRMRDFGDGDGTHDRAPADVVYFGLGATTTIDSLVVRWPSGAIQRINSGLTVDSVLSLQEPESLDFAASDDTYENRVVLTWRGADGTGYLHKLYRRLPAEPAPGTLLSFLSSGDSTYSDATGTAGVEYIYTLEKYSVPGNVHITTESDAGRRIIFAPDYITASNGSFSDRIQIIWGDRSTIEAGYRLLLPQFDPWTIGQVVFQTPAPTSVDVGALESNTELTLFPEQQELTLLADLPVGVIPTAGATVKGNGAAGLEGVIAAGTVVRSYMIHGDQIGSSGSLHLAGTAHFDAPILGLIIASDSLTATDGLLGNPGTTYPAGVGSRGSESSGEIFTFGSDLRSLSVDFDILGSTDQARILVLGGERSATVGANQSTYQDTHSPPEVTQDYELYAFDDAGATSDTVSVSGLRARLLPPRNVQATDGTHADRVVVSWGASTDSTDGLDPDLSYYRILRRDTPGSGVYAEIDSVDGRSSVRYDDLTGLGVVHEYTVTFVAVDEGGVPIDESVLGIPDATDTGIGGDSTMVKVLDVMASDDTYDDRVAVTWNDSPLEEFYIITRDNVPLDTLAAGLTIYSDVTAVPATTYTYGVIAGTQYGGRSPLASDTGSRSTIITVTNLAASDGTSESQVDITWESGSTTAALYYIYRDDVLIKTAPGTARSCPDEDVDTEVHTYKVVGVTAAGTQAAPVADTGYRRILPPTRVTASDNEFEDLVEITWQDNSAVETGYRILRWPLGGLGTPDTLAVVPRDGTFFRDMTAVSRTAYTYGVQALDDLGTSEVETENGRRALLAPSGAEATRGQYEDRIEVTWADNSKRENGYYVYRRLAGDPGDSVYVGETGANAQRFIDTGAQVPIAFGETYEYSVLAFDDWGTSLATKAQGYAEILPPSSVNASDDYPGGISLVWTDVSNVETGYEITIDGTPVDTLPPNSTSYFDAVTVGPAEYCVTTLYNARSSESRCDTGSRSSGGGIPPADLIADRRIVEKSGGAMSETGRAFFASPSTGVYTANGWRGGPISVYDRDGDVWTVTDTIPAPLDSIPDLLQFGYSMACNEDGTRLAVACSAQNSQGYVLLYEKTGFGWDLVQEIPRWVEAAGMVLHGDRLLIAAQFPLLPPANKQVDLFERTASGWDSTMTFQASVPWNDLGSGVVTNLHEANIDMSDSLVVVGKPLDYGSPDGRAVVFRLTPGGAWTEIGILNTPGNGTGLDAAVEGKDILVMDEGAVYAFHLEDDGAITGPVDTGALTGVAFTPTETFLRPRMALSDGLLLTGIGEAGVATITEWNGVQWQRTAVVTGSSPTPAGDYGFGTTVILRGDFGLVMEESGVYPLRNTSKYFLNLPRHPVKLDAADGTNKERIRLLWDDRSLNEAGYEVTRDGAVLAVLPSDSRSFEDSDAEPGRSYEYAVRALGPDNFTRLDPPRDFGRIVPNGRIGGRIATPIGAGVPGVEVCLTPAVNTSVLFDGVEGGGHAVTRGGPALPATFTLEFWVKPTDLSTQQVMVSKVAADSTVILEVRSSNFYSGGPYDGIEVDMNGAVAYMPQYLVAGAWRHIDVALGGGNLRVRISDEDGALLHQGVWPLTPPADLAPEAPWALGARRLPDADFVAGDATLNLDGQIDEVRLWSRLLTTAEIDDAMASRLTGTENGLLAYWPLDERIGVVAEELAGNAYMELIAGAYWAEDAAFAACALTDSQGNYNISGIRYGTGADIRVTPMKDPGEFEPDFKNISLNSSNPVWNQVDFTEVTSFTISGRVAFEGGGCPVEGVEVLVDDVSKGTTDADGLYSVSVQPGTRVVSVARDGFEFAQASREVDVSADLPNTDFEAVTKRFLTVQLGGGCRGDSVGTYTVRVVSASGCYDEMFDATADTELNLSPQAYTVSVVDVNGVPPTIGKVSLLKYYTDLGPQEVDLTDENGTGDLRYQAPLQVRIPELDGEGCSALNYPGGVAAAPDGVLEQLSRLPLTIEVYSEYGDGSPCYPDSGTITIVDEVIDRTEPVTLEFHDGQAAYTTAANTPNIFAGRRDASGADRSYQKPITVVVQSGARVATRTFWVLVTGHKPRTASFVATAEEIPILILRDPPGDASYSYLSKEESFCTTLTGTQLKGISDTKSVEVKVGLEFDLGLIFSSPTEINAGTFKLDVNRGAERTTSKDFQICASTTETFRTSAGQAFIGQDADVFLSAGVNFAFAETDVIDLDRENGVCTVVPSKSVAVEPQGFESALLFTRRHIEEEEIPRLTYLAEQAEAKGDGASGVIYRSAVENWKNQLALADQLRAQSKFRQNRSFSAGADFEYSAVSDTTETKNFQVKTFTKSSSSLGVGFDIGGVGLDVTYGAQLDFAMTRSNGTTGTTRRTVGYVLSDDDPGDFFSVDVREDRDYGTPVFDLKFGNSSCPWEAPTLKRDLPIMSVQRADGPDPWPADQPAQYVLNLQNGSESDEDRTYVVLPVQVSNPDGAVIKINGVVLGNSGVEFTVPRFDRNGNKATTRATLTVERGPSRYIYEGLQLRMISPCELEAGNAGYPTSLDTTVTFDVRFDGPCSDVNVALPEEGWVHNLDDKVEADSTLGGDYELVFLNEFDLSPQENKDVSEIGAQYRRVGTETWETIGMKEPAKVPLDNPNEIQLLWDLSGLPDGTYEIRGYTKCTNSGAGTSAFYTQPVRGVIDRAGPIRLANNPSDGVLSLGETITASFNENIDCGSLVVGCDPTDPDCVENVSLFRDPLGANEQVEIDVACRDNVLTITPVNLKALAGQTVRARLNGIPDLAGNRSDDPTVPGDDLTWDFQVTQNVFAWTQAADTLRTEAGYAGLLTAVLANGTNTAVAFTVDLSGAPVELSGQISASPSSGNLAPGETREIRFTVSDAAPTGIWNVPVVADGNGGAYTSNLALVAEIGCGVPGWTVNPADFEHTMTLVGRVRIEGTPTADPADMLAAFVGDELRGVAHATADSLAFLTVYSNNQSGERVRFRIWDDSECKLYTYAVVDDPGTLLPTDAVFFGKDAVLGMVSDPVILDARQPVAIATTEIPVAAGWTWISLNRMTALGLTTSLVLGDLNLNDGDLIKTRGTVSNPNPFAMFSALCGWGCDPNGLDSLDVVHGYMVKLAQAGTILLEGNPVDPMDPANAIQVESGWNMIGYPGTIAASVNSAFGNVSAPFHPGDGDLVKSQYAFAQFDSISDNWYGDLETGLMAPGQGYMLYASAADSFHYPSTIAAGPGVFAAAAEPVPEDRGYAGRASLRSRLRAPSAPMPAAVLAPRNVAPGVRTAQGPGWAFNPGDYQYTMTMTGSLDPGELELDGNQVVAAVVDGEVRGWARPQYVEAIQDYRLFMMIYSNQTGGETVEFRFYDDLTSDILTMRETLAFKSDEIVGMVSDPFRLSVSGSGTGGVILGPALRAVSPNPAGASQTVQISFELAKESRVHLMLFDIRGRHLGTLLDESFPAGRHQIEYRNPGLATGVYLFRFQAGGKTMTRKLTVLP